MTAVVTVLTLVTPSGGSSGIRSRGESHSRSSDVASSCGGITVVPVESWYARGAANLATA